MQHVQNCIFHSYVFLVGKLEGVKILSNLYSLATNKESDDNITKYLILSHELLIVFVV